MKETITARIELTAEDIQELLAQYVQDKFGHECDPADVTFNILHKSYDQRDVGPGTPYVQKAVVKATVKG